MSVISVDEIDGREVERSENMNRRINRSYRIRCDRPDEEEAVVIIGSNMPVILAPHPTVPQLRCTSVRCTQQTDNDPFVWIAKVTWASIVLSRRAANTSADPSKRNENPLLRPAVLSFATEKFQRTARRARTNITFTDGVTTFTAGRDILNSSFDQFESPVMKDDFRPTITITKNVPTWSTTEWRAAINKLNLTDFLGFGPGEVKVADITGSEGFENDIPFFTKVGQFHVASEEDGDWLVRALDCGYQIDGLNGKIPISLPDGTKPSTPPRLDGDGALLSPNTSASFYMEADIYGYYDLDSLGFY
jgi:hypothetical protein